MADSPQKSPLVGSTASGGTRMLPRDLRNQDLSATRSKIGVGRRFLLLDSRIVSTTTNMDLTIGSAEKHLAKLFSFDLESNGSKKDFISSTTSTGGSGG